MELNLDRVCLPVAGENGAWVAREEPLSPGFRDLCLLSRDE